MNTKRLSLAAAGLLPLVLAAQRTCAQLVYEPFDYGSAAAGTNLANLTGSPTFSGYTNPSSGINWTTMSTAFGSPNEITVGSGNIDGTSTPGFTTGLAPAVGGLGQYADANNTNSRSAHFLITPGAFTSGTVYYSMRFKVTDIGGMLSTGAGGFFATLSDGTGSPTTSSPSGPARLQLRAVDSPATAFNILVKAQTNTNTPPQAQVAPGSYHQGDEIFVVVGFNFNGTTPGDDTSSLWVNPDSSSLGLGTPPPTSCPDATQGADVAGIASFALRQGNGFLPHGIQVDELRIDTTWAAVTAPVGAVWTGASGGNWSTSANWSTGTAPNAAAQFITLGAGDGGIVNVDSPRTVGTINIKNTNAYTLSGAALTLDGGAGGAAAINLEAVMDATGPGNILTSTHVISAPLSLASKLSANISAGQTLTISGNISGNATIDKNGGGALLLSGNNTNVGTVTAGNGVLGITSDAALGDASNVLKIDGGTVRAGGTINGTRAVNVNANVIGNGAYGGGTLDTNSNSVTIGAVVGTGTLTKVGAGVLSAASFRNPTLTVNAGTARVTTNGTESATSNVKALNIAGTTDAWTAQFDLNDSSAVIDYSGTSPLATIQNQIKTGYAGGAWTGNGMNSSAAAAAASSAHKTAIGYREASEMFTTFPATFRGQNVPDNTAVLLRYTLAGDNDLSGGVDLTDFTFLAANFNKTGGATWIQGDYNYDGNVDLTDFTFLASNFNQSVPADALGSAVPEPASIGALGIAAMLSVRRRRR